MGFVELQSLRGMEVAADGQQRRRILFGEGLVKPKVPTTYRDPDYGLLIFRPGRDRLNPSHPAVRANPLGFEAAWARDVATRLVLCNMQERALKSGGRPRARSRGSTRLYFVDSTARRPRLPGADRRQWKLP